MAQLLSMRFLIGFALICAASPFPQGSDLTACGHGLALVPAPGLIAKGIIPSSGRASASCIRHRTTSSLRHFRESTTVVHMTPFRDGQGGSAGGGSGNAGGGGTGGSGFDKKAEEAVDNYGSENSEMSVELVAEEVVDGKVKVFGAWMDATVAGRGGLESTDADKKEKQLAEKLMGKAGGNYTLAREMARENTEQLVEAERLFQRGLSAMRLGRYSQAVDGFQSAIDTVPGGAKSREGGSYSVWLAQALDAKGAKGEAVRTLKACMKHPDRDVRRVAEGLEFIMLAPKLDLEENSFTWIELEKLTDIAEGGKGNMYAKMEKMPEKYSLEWYMMQKPPPKMKPRKGNDLLAAVGTLSVCALGYLGYTAVTGGF